MDQKNLLSHTFELIRKQRFHQRWRQVVTCLAAVVVFLTTYMLILPAITMEHGSMEVTPRDVTKEEHQSSTGTPRDGEKWPHRDSEARP